MMAGGAIDPDKIAKPKILNPRQVKRLHSGLCSWNVLIMLAGSSTGIAPVHTPSRLRRPIADLT